MSESANPSREICVDLAEFLVAYTDDEDHRVEVSFQCAKTGKKKATRIFRPVRAIAIAQSICAASSEPVRWEGVDDAFIQHVMQGMGWDTPNGRSMHTYWGYCRGGTEKPRVQVVRYHPARPKEKKIALAKELFRGAGDRYWLGSRAGVGPYTYWAVRVVGETGEADRKLRTLVEEYCKEKWHSTVSGREPQIRCSEYAHALIERLRRSSLLQADGNQESHPSYLQRRLVQSREFADARGMPAHGTAGVAGGNLMNDAATVLHQHEILTRLQDRSVCQVLCIAGEAGSGKSTLLQRLAIDLARAWTGSSAGRMPFLVSLSDWSFRRHGSLLDLICMSDRRLDLPLVTGIAAGGQAVILLDGLDQIPATRHRRLRFIQWFIKELADPAVATCPVVISGRPWAFDRHILCHPRVQQFGLMDLASKDVRRYIAEYPFADAARRNRALRSFARVPRASLLLDRPLLLDGFCFACDRSPAASVRTETQIVEQTVHELLEQRGIGRIPALEALAHLAWQCWNSPGHQLDAASAASAVASGPRVSEKVVRSARTTLSRSLIQHLSRHSGILLDHSGHYCFAHDVYLEYFVGRWLASANPNTIKRIFGMHAWAPAWDGVITFMMSHLWRQDRQVAACLVRWLLAEAQAGHDDIWKTLALLAGRAMVGLGGDRDAKENALVQEVIESVLEAWSCRVRYCTGHNGRLAAMRTLLGLADFDQQAVLRGLVAALATDDLAVAATEVLGLLDCEASELELRRIARSATSAVLRTAAVKVLGTLDSSAALDTVIGALHDSDVTVRCQAARSLGDNGSSVAIQALVAAVRSAPCDTRGEVIDVLGHLDAPSAVPAILAVLSGEVSAADQQRVVVRALGRLRVGDAVGIMEKLATESGDSLFCTEVVDALAQIGTDEAIAALARLAKQDRGCARGDALEILSCVAPTSTTLCILKDALADGDPHLRATAVSALGILALPEAADVLVRVFRDDRDELVRARAASALGLCRCVDAVDLLMQAVGGDKLMLAWTASIAIVRILGSATAVRAFVDALARGGSVARGIPAILGFLGSAAAGDALPERDRLTPGEKTSLRLEIFQNAVAAIIAAVSNTSPDIRAAACSSLGQLGAYQGIKVLLLALGDTTAARVRQSAADALGKLGAVQAAKELIRTLRDDSDAETRARAGSALGELRCVEAESSLITALKDNNSRVRCAAADALGLIRSKSAARQLQPLLAHTDPSCRRAAVRALGRIGLISQRVIRMLRNDPDGGVRWAAARALGEVQCTDGISALTQALVDVDDLVAKDAAVALGQIRAEESVPYLIGALRDTRPDRRGWAAQALGMIGTSSAVHGLLEIIDDDQMVPYFQESRTVGQLAAEALLRINDPETLPRLVGDLGHPEPRRQRKAFAGLLLFQPPEFAKAVLPALNRCSRQAGILLEHYCQRHSVTVSASGRAVGPELLTLNASLCPILPASPLK